MRTGEAEVFDLGYQRYTGPREGRSRARLALFENGVRTVLGIGRGGRAKILPVGLFLAVMTPAVVFVTILAFLDPLAGDDAADFIPGPADYYSLVSVVLIIFGAIMAPELLCPDRRDNVLPLYLVRPLTSNDYLIARFLAFFVIVLALVYAGQIVLQAGLILTANDQVEYLRENWLDLPRILLMGVLIAAFISVGPLAVAAFTTRRAYAAAFVIAAWLAAQLHQRRSHLPGVYEYNDHPGRSTHVEHRGVHAPRRRPCAVRRTAPPGRGYGQHQQHGVRHFPRTGGRRSVVGGRLRTARRVPRRRVRALGRHPRPAVVAPLPEDTAMTTAFTPAVEVQAVSKWYGSVVAVNDVSFDVYPGVTGILGPNGAGKTTLLSMMCGLVKPSRGGVRVLGEEVQGNIGLYRRIGVMLEHDVLYPFMTGRDFVRLAARLQGMNDEAAVDRAIHAANLEDAQHRPTGTYSRGMRQRIRLAAAVVHEPEVLVLDEPLNGTDPRQRVEFGDFVARLSAQGKAILISSHILEEVEALADRILLVVSGKLAASGDFHAIREKLDERPFQVRIGASRQREMAAALVGLDAVESVSLAEGGSIEVLTRNVAELQRMAPKLAQEIDSRLYRIEPLDDSLESVFSYVVQR